MVKIKNKQRKIKVNQKIIRRAGEETLKREAVVRREENFGGLASAEVSIALVTDSHIRSLNLRYRGVRKTTDVLAFSMQEGETIGFHSHLLGDVVISVERASEQAGEFKHSLEEELSFLTIHGTLHLLGYDDQTSKGRKEMKVREKEILKAVKLLN